MNHFLGLHSCVTHHRLLHVQQLMSLTLRVYLEYVDASRKQVKSIRALMTSHEDAFFHYSHFFDSKVSFVYRNDLLNGC